MVNVGDTLTAIPAVVVGYPTPVRTWRWRRDGVLLAGADSDSYVVTAHDLGTVLSVEQIETNVYGTDIAASTSFDIAWTPRALFADGQKGGWWDIQDLDTLFEDAEATTPASLNGPVGCVLDKSGNGYNLTQTTATARPSLRNVGGKWRLYSDGSDDFLSFVNPAIEGSAAIAAEFGVLVLGVNIIRGTPRQTFTTHRVRYDQGTQMYRNLYGLVLRHDPLTSQETTRLNEWYVKHTELQVGDDVMLGQTTQNSRFYVCNWISSTPRMNLTTSTSCYRMFHSNVALESVEPFDASNATGAAYYEMFISCFRLRQIPDGLVFATGRTGQSFVRMFQNCYELTNIPWLDTSLATDLTSFSPNCYAVPTMPLLDTGNVTNFSGAFSGMFGLTEFPAINTSKALRIDSAWTSCINLLSFPWIDTSLCTNFTSAWYNCYSIVDPFPAIDVSKATTLFQTWYNCRAMTGAMPTLHVPNVTSFYRVMRDCRAITSIDFTGIAKCTDFREAWLYCTSLQDVPAGMFDTSIATNYASAFTACALTQQSVDNILASLVVSGRTGGTIHLNGGTSATPSAAGLASKATLNSRGWTVYHN